MANEEPAANQDRSVPHAYPKLVEAYLDIVMGERRDWAERHRGPCGSLILLSAALKAASEGPDATKIEAVKRAIAAFEEETAGEVNELFRAYFPPVGAQRQPTGQQS